jgi:CubicO group peptidase (beta-lactamase class C family)
MLAVTFSCQPELTQLEKKIDAVVMRAVELDQFSGSVLVAKDGEILYGKAFGEADKNRHLPNTMNTMFNIGSIGKTFTGTAIMQVVQKGLVDLHEPVTSYLPDFPFGDRITTHHLLSHTSGLFDYMQHPEYQTIMSTYRRVGDYLPLVYDQELVFDEPGSQMAYSNSGIIVLGAVLEAVTGQSYSEYLQKNIFDPLGMDHTSLDFSGQAAENKSIGYIPTLSDDFTSNESLAPPVASPAGGLNASALDMLKFDQALYTEKLLNTATRKLMFTPILQGYGYCWGILERFNNTITTHSGGAEGISAWLRRYHDDKYTIIVLSNYDRGASPVFRRIEAILFEQEYDLPRLAAGKFIYNKIIELGFEYTLANIQSILKEHGYPIQHSGILNAFGYQLLTQGNPGLAIQIFSINVELFSDESNPWDSLGDASFAVGDEQTALECYSKALSIDPDYENAQTAREVVRKLSGK